MDLNKVRSEGNVANQVGEAKVRGGQASKSTTKVSNATESQNSGATRETGTSPSSEKVKLSGDVEVVREGVEAARVAPDVRADKVAALKEQIRKGTYKVDTQAVADKMLKASLEEDLLTRSE